MTTKKNVLKPGREARDIPRIADQPASSQKFFVGGLWVAGTLLGFFAYARIGVLLSHGYPELSSGATAGLLLLSITPTIVCLAMVVRSFHLYHQIAKEGFADALGELKLSTLLRLWNGEPVSRGSASIDLDSDERFILETILDRQLPHDWREKGVGYV